MQLDVVRSLPVPARADAAWALLGDTRATIGCVPGARIQPQSVGPRLQGALAVKVGAASLGFDGWLERRLRDDATREQRWSAQAADAAGGSKAEMEVTLRVLRIEDDDERCTLEAAATVTITGRAAALGQVALEAAAGQLFSQFARRFVERVRIVQGRMPVPMVAPVVAKPAPAAAPPPAELPAAGQMTVQAEAAPPAPAGPASPASGVTVPPARSPWQRFLAWCRRFFGTPPHGAD